MRAFRLCPLPRDARACLLPMVGGLVRSLKILAILLPATALAIAPAAGQIEARPSTGAPGPGLLTAGQLRVLGLGLALSFAVDRSTRGLFVSERGGVTNDFARVGNLFGDGNRVLPALGLVYVTGHLLGEPGVSETAWRAGEAVLVSGLIATALKDLVGRERPYPGGDPDRFIPFERAERYRSFPSGHATVAFATATVLAQETPDDLSDVAFYAAATLTGLARLNDDQHWASDVVAGAVLGHVIGKWMAGDDRQPSLVITGTSVALSLHR